MPSRRDVWLLIPRPVRRIPADLAGVMLLTLLTGAVVLLPYLNETPIRVVLGLPFVLFLPGYAFIAALFPEEGEPPQPPEDEAEETSRLRDRGIDGIERVALSFGLSIAIVPLLGLGLNFTPWGITLVPILLTVGGFTLVASVVATIRRWELPPEKRFSVPYRDWIDRGREEVFEPDDRVDAALNVLLALSIILAVVTVGYAVMFPPAGEQFTEFYLLTEDEDGDRVAANYPSEFVIGESAPVIVGIENNEHESVNYTAVVELQRVDHDDNASVIERSEIDRFEVDLAHNETWQEERSIAPDMTGEDLRVQYLLYMEEPPDEPTRENAYRDLHLWITVEEADETD